VLGTKLCRSAGLAVGGAALLAGCSSAAAPSASPPQTTPAAQVSPAGSSPPVCPNPDGGTCVGPLTAGQTYRTATFQPAITYTVPAAGWSNLEDLSGNFLLVPPGNNLAGVNAGTSDYIGVYTAITPATLDQLPSCAFGPPPGLAGTPAAMATWFERQRPLAATLPQPVTVGGLHGLVLDLKLRPQAKMQTCIDDLTGKRLHMYPLITGLFHSELEHTLVPRLTLRLYLLTSGHHVLGIEVDDIPNAPGRLQTLSAEVNRLQFAAGS